MTQTDLGIRYLESLASLFDDRPHLRLRQPRVHFDPTALHSGGASRSVGMEMMHLWTTPVLIVRPELRELELFNRRLSGLALEAFQHVADHSPQGITGSSADGLNERFFAWQKEQFQHASQSDGRSVSEQYAALVNNGEFTSLTRMFVHYSQTFLGMPSYTDCETPWPYTWIRLKKQGWRRLSAGPQWDLEVFFIYLTLMKMQR
jgi:hypothetical protein